MANPDDKGQAELSADTDGEGKVRIDGQYLAQALRACGGMVEFKLTSPLSPMLFSANGYQLVVMPMITSEAQKAEAERAKAQKAQEPQPSGEAEPTEPVAEAELAKPKKASRKRKQAVTA